MRKELIFPIILCFVLSGCSSLNNNWNPFYKPADIAQPVTSEPQEIAAAVESNPFLETGRILNSEALSKGGTLLIVPFRAGPGVESNERLDDLGLKVVQGISDELKDYRPYFKVITDEGKESADIVLKGFFMEVGSDSKLKKWLPGSKLTKLSLKGQMVQPNSDKPILVFTDSVESEDKDYLSISYEVGQNIGRFIRSGASK